MARIDTDSQIGYQLEVANSILDDKIRKHADVESCRFDTAFIGDDFFHKSLYDVCLVERCQKSVEVKVVMHALPDVKPNYENKESANKVSYNYKYSFTDEMILSREIYSTEIEDNLLEIKIGLAHNDIMRERIRLHSKFIMRALNSEENKKQYINVVCLEEVLASYNIRPIALIVPKYIELRNGLLHVSDDSKRLGCPVLPINEDKPPEGRDFSESIILTRDASLTRYERDGCFFKVIKVDLDSGGFKFVVECKEKVSYILKNPEHIFTF